MDPHNWQDMAKAPLPEAAKAATATTATKEAPNQLGRMAGSSLLVVFAIEA